MVFNSGKEYVGEKTKDNPIGGLLSKLPVFKNDKKSDNRSVVKDKIKLEEENKESAKFTKRNTENDKSPVKKEKVVNKADTVKKTENKKSVNDKKLAVERPEKEKVEKKQVAKKENASKKKETRTPVKITASEKKENKDKYKSRNFKIYFNRINGNERLVMSQVSRNVRYTDSPLTETLKILLNGPTTNERNLDMITNIPDKTRLLSVTVKNNIAYINLSKEFEYNKYGRESTLNQLKQIVYTATEFPTVNSVQFMIEGKVKNYLGGEGVVIGKPLSRNDFS